MRVALRHERDGIPLLTSAPCSTDAVHVVLDIAWRVVVDDEGDTLDVQTARSDICGNENLDFTLLEAVQSCLTFALVFVAMDGRARHPLSINLLRQLVAHALRGAEDQALGRGVVAVGDAGLTQDLHHLAVLIVAAAGLQELCDVLVALQLVAVADGDRVCAVQELLGQPAHGRRPGGGVEHGVPLTGHLRQDLADLRLEAHVEHAVRLVHAQEAHRLQVDHAALDEVVQATRSSREQVRPAPDIRELRPLRRTAVGQRRDDASRAAKLLGVRIDLNRQFARWCHDQHNGCTRNSLP
mmetsp:Transcript_103587/g.278300  ORF Transcript_103587/g.278300 Transcript_103587/m.278300 type:complete len:297 (+) Transcript_103587:356-1246(+)